MNLFVYVTQIINKARQSILQRKCQYFFGLSGKFQNLFTIFLTNSFDMQTWC